MVRQDLNEVGPDIDFYVTGMNKFICEVMTVLETDSDCVLLVEDPYRFFWHPTMLERLEVPEYQIEAEDISLLYG